MTTESDMLYDHDFYSWTKGQAAALRRAAAERVNVAVPIDWSRVAEEIEDMGKEQADKLEFGLPYLLLHLLDWRHQPDKRSPSWRGSIVEHRRRALRLIEKNPGLKPRRGAFFDGLRRRPRPSRRRALTSRPRPSPKPRPSRSTKPWRTASSREAET